jgi:hypothetical protein
MEIGRKHYFVEFRNGRASPQFPIDRLKRSRLLNSETPSVCSRFAAHYGVWGHAIYGLSFQIYFLSKFICPFREGVEYVLEVICMKHLTDLPQTSQSQKEDANAHADKCKLPGGKDNGPDMKHQSPHQENKREKGDEYKYRC